MKLIFPRKENCPHEPVLEERQRRSDLSNGLARIPRIISGDPERDPAVEGRRGRKAPFTHRVKALPLLIFPLITLLIFSFHLLSSPALAAGEGAPSFQWPARGEVVNPFRPSSGLYGAGGHAGIDISLPSGTDVRASAPGKVAFAGRTPVGVCVSIVHQGGFKTTYVSLKSAAVRRGDEVDRGRVVGLSDGSMDRSSSLPHLHFGLFLNGIAIDPLPFLQGRFLDPGECLFLGPWEDTGAIDTYFKRHDGGGFFGWVGRGFESAGGAVVKAFKGALNMAGEAMASAWRWTCRAFQAAGRGFSEFYGRCIRPWSSPLWKGIVTAAKKVFSNRYVQALLAGLAAAVVICAAVAAVALVIGISVGTAIAAAIIGSVAAIGYSLYYAFSSGDSFSFTSCFLASLAVGGAAAVSSLLFSYMAPLIGAGWSNLGFAGFAKAFVIHGFADSSIYTVFCLVTGREVSPWGLLASFLVGGLLGGMGKLFTSGLFSEGTVQALAAGWLSSGGTLLSGGGAARLAGYFWALAVHFTQKAAYVFFCGCTGFLVDVLMRALTGGVPSPLESLLSFAGGALAGGLGLASGGEGLSGLLTRLSRGRIRMSGDLLKTVVGKSFTKGLKKGFSALLRRITGGKRGLEEGLWSQKLGGDG